RLGHQRVGLVDQPQRGADALEIQRARVSQAQAGGQALEQRHAQASLERADMLADRALGQAQLFRAAAEVQAARGGQEDAQRRDGIAGTFHDEPGTWRPRGAEAGHYPARAARRNAAHPYGPARRPPGFFFYDAVIIDSRTTAGWRMNTEYLESFAKVVECRSLAEAARRLHLTSGAVAARIRILESELATTLVQRSGQTITPTEAGMRIYDRAKELIQSARDLQAIASSGAPEGELQLGAFPSALTTHVPVLLDGFCARHPDLSIYIAYDASAELCRRVHLGQLDAAVVIEPTFAIHTNCDLHTLQEEPLIVIAPAHMAGRDAHDLLLHEPFIRYDRMAHSGQLVDRYLKDNALVPRQRIEVDS